METRNETRTRLISKAAQKCVTERSCHITLHPKELWEEMYHQVRYEDNWNRYWENEGPYGRNV